MATRRRTFIWLIGIVVVGWNFFYFVRYSLNYRSSKGDNPDGVADSPSIMALRLRLDKVQKELHGQSHFHVQLLNLLRKEGNQLGAAIIQRANNLAENKRPLELVKRNTSSKSVHGEPQTLEMQLPVLVIACNRVTVKRSLDLLLKYRPSVSQYPIIVSQDCGHASTATAIKSYGDQIIHIQQPNLSGFNLPPSQRRFEGYYKISRHYKWALDQIFLKFNHTAVIIVEDDLEVAPDFFQYFQSTYPILRSDPSLMCVSAWNDNGKSDLISDDSTLLHRTDFFPGLGWMLKRSLWVEIREKWPPAFWDEYMRRPEIRKDRACIRPEISRSSTFGRTGVSNGQFFDKHLKFIRLNQHAVDFTKRDMSYLSKEAYDANFEVEVYTKPEVSVNQVIENSIGPISGPVRITYEEKNQFRNIARLLGMMDDFKAGVPRTAYRGVVSIFYRGRRVYVAPKRPWHGYSLSWT